MDFYFTFFPHFSIAKQYESTVNALPTIKLRKVTGDMETALLRISGTALQETAPATAIKQYKYHYAMGMSLKNDDDDSITAWHSVEMKHSSPIALNLVHTAIINSYAASDGYSISITNEPLSIQPDEELNDEGLIMRADATFEFLFPFIVYIIMSILSAKYTSFYIEVCVFHFSHFNWLKIMFVFFSFHKHTGEAVQCEIYAICFGCSDANFLGYFNSMGYADYHNRYFRNNADAAHLPAKTFSNTNRIPCRVCNIVHVQFCNDTDHMYLVIDVQ